MFSVAPMNQKLELLPGEVYAGSVLVINPDSAKGNFSYRAEVSPYAVVGEDYAADFLQDNATTEIVEWITIENPRGEVGPNQSANINFTIRVPEQAPVGGQYAAILVSSDTPNNEDEGVAINNVFEIATLIYANVAGEMIHEGEILDNSIPGFSVLAPITVSATLNNNGNTHETAAITLEVRDLLSAQTIYPLSGESGAIQEIVLPNTTRLAKREVNVVSSPGIYDVIQTVSYLGETSTVRQTVIICPIWLILLSFAVLAACVGGIVGLIIKRKRKKYKMVEVKS